jgi:hypothetical protein
LQVWNRKNVLWLCWSYSFIKTYVMANMIAHIECHMDKKNAIKWERRQWIDHMCLMSIGVIKYIQGMKTHSSTSTLQGIINVSSLKTQRVLWIMMVIEEGSTHDEPYIGEEKAEVLASRYRMWWRRTSECLSLGYQSCHEESHGSKCWYLLNQKINVTWTRRDVLIVQVKEIYCRHLKAKLLKSRSCWCPQT